MTLKQKVSAHPRPVEPLWLAKLLFLSAHQLSKISHHMTFDSPLIRITPWSLESYQFQILKSWLSTYQTRTLSCERLSLNARIYLCFHLKRLNYAL